MPMRKKFNSAFVSGIVCLNVLPLASAAPRSLPARPQTFFKKPQRFRYVLQQTRLKPEGVRLRIYGPHHRLVWTCNEPTVSNLDVWKWSHDHRSLAFVERFASAHEPHLRLTVWNSDGKVRHFDHPLDLFQDENSVQELHWSPDDQRLLLQTDFSAISSLDVSNAWYMRLPTGHVRRLSPPLVRRAEWTSPQRIRYWAIKHPIVWVKDRRSQEIRPGNWTVPAVDPRPRYWSCP